MLNITKMLTLSTAHIKQETEKILIKWKNHNYFPGLAIYDKDDFGWWIYVGDVSAEDCRDFPKDLVACISFAQQHGCEWLCLDGDEEVIQALSAYEWYDDEE